MKGKKILAALGFFSIAGVAGGCSQPAPEIRYQIDSGKNVQAIRHRHLPLYGIQFHPESILTPDGEALLRNFLSLPAGSREKRRIK